MKICDSCQKEYIPSSRHRVCPKCRIRKIDSCISCGSPSRDSDSGRCKKCYQFADSNPKWKGGKVNHGKGYVLVHSPDHPKVAGRVSKYMMEHILVMEAHLGRFLYPNETVHHKNGIRNDNRLDNLELWVKPQPSGIRAEDAVEWAVTLLSRYAPDKLK